MKTNNQLLQQSIAAALSGKGAHTEALSAMEGLDWKLAGACPAHVSHSVFQLVNHMAFWQDWAVEWLDGRDPSIPRHAAGSWPGNAAPASAHEWKQAVKQFRRGLEELSRRGREMDLSAKPGKKSVFQMLQTIASHNSYHIGQVVLVRRMLEAWPPPSGGLTW